MIIATGVDPRDPQIDGQDLPHVHSYIDVLKNKVSIGKTAVVIGAGGIGFDVSEFLTHGAAATPETPDLPEWLREWGVVDPETARGGLSETGPQPSAPARQVTMLQRKPERPGKRLGKTTGWIHRATLKMKGVKMISGVNYEKITPEGIYVSFGEARENPQLIPADDIILCTGQVSQRSLGDACTAAGLSVEIIGGADFAGELDAKRAIDQGMRVAYQI